MQLAVQGRGVVDLVALAVGNPRVYAGNVGVESGTRCARVLAGLPVDVRELRHVCCGSVVRHEVSACRQGPVIFGKPRQRQIGLRLVG